MWDLILLIHLFWQAFVFKTKSRECAAFLVNRGVKDVSVLFQNVTYKLPSYSISILPDCKTVAFNTKRASLIPTADFSYSSLIFNPWNTIHQVSVQYNTRTMKAVQKFDSPEKWQEFNEPIPRFDQTTLRENKLLEQTGITKDSTDYLWYTMR